MVVVKDVGMNLRREDFLGLKELGIASEFGLSSLSVPKKLLRGKKGVKPAFVPCVYCLVLFSSFICYYELT